VFFFPGSAAAAAAAAETPQHEETRLGCGSETVLRGPRKAFHCFGVMDRAARFGVLYLNELMNGSASRDVFVVGCRSGGLYFIIVKKNYFRSLLRSAY